MHACTEESARTTNEKHLRDLKLGGENKRATSFNIARDWVSSPSLAGPPWRLCETTACNERWTACPTFRFLSCENIVAAELQTDTVSLSVCRRIQSAWPRLSGSEERRGSAWKAPSDARVCHPSSPCICPSLTPPIALPARNAALSAPLAVRLG